ncbi:ParB/RepB/Spo0J family partition protein [Phenylobacterium sp.]|jgi:ParB family chromosome partitioning protein|uniref:ParB/RepB/Spo0J family partition protein n=1 Tax=Phenylobacterium sp. TaxID=1871053 RepID=UPI002F41B40A
MAEGRRGLGRGLSALMDEVDPAIAAQQGARSRAETPIELIQPNPDQPRRSFPEAEIEELAQSIREKGVLQPILLRPAPRAPGRFEIVVGERRWRAAQRAGLVAVPAVVRELDDLQVLEIAIVENVQREDLNALEEAMAYKALLERFGRTQEAVARAVSKSRSHVANTLRLLQLPPAVQDHVAAGRLSAGHARAIAASENAAALAERIVAAGLSVREAETMARADKGAPRKAAARKAGSKDADTLALEHDLAEVLGLDVGIVDHGGAGELTIRYETLEQLDDLCRRLTRG